jgi:hypothetical protein
MSETTTTPAAAAAAAAPAQKVYRNIAGNGMIDHVRSKKEVPLIYKNADRVLPDITVKAYTTSVKRKGVESGSNTIFESISYKDGPHVPLEKSTRVCALDIYKIAETIGRNPIEDSSESNSRFERVVNLCLGTYENANKRHHDLTCSEMEVPSTESDVKRCKLIDDKDPKVFTDLTDRIIRQYSLNSLSVIHSIVKLLILPDTSAELRETVINILELGASRLDHVNLMLSSVVSVQENFDRIMNVVLEEPVRESLVQSMIRLLSNTFRSNLPKPSNKKKLVSLLQHAAKMPRLWSDMLRILEGVISTSLTDLEYGCVNVSRILIDMVLSEPRDDMIIRRGLMLLGKSGGDVTLASYFKERTDFLEFLAVSELGSVASVMRLTVLIKLSSYITLEAFYRKGGLDVILKGISIGYEEPSLLNIIRKDFKLISEICGCDRLIDIVMSDGVNSISMILTILDNTEDTSSSSSNLIKRIAKMFNKFVPGFPNLEGDVRAQTMKVIQKIDEAAVNNGCFGEIMKQLECSITYQVMVDPVQTTTGFTFERDAIIKWVTEKGICPFAKSKLAAKDLSPSHAIRGMCNDIREKAWRALAASATAI